MKKTVMRFEQPGGLSDIVITVSEDGHVHVENAHAVTVTVPTVSGEGMKVNPFRLAKKLPHDGQVSFHLARLSHEELYLGVRGSVDALEAPAPGLMVRSTYGAVATVEAVRNRNEPRVTLTEELSLRLPEDLRFK